jgi:hypothetical protein
MTMVRWVELDYAVGERKLLRLGIHEVGSESFDLWGGRRLKQAAGERDCGLGRNAAGHPYQVTRLLVCNMRH